MVSNLNHLLRHRVFISLILAPYIILSTFNHKVFLVNIIIIFFLSVYEWNRSVNKILDKVLGIIILSIFSISLFYINLENNINCIWLLFTVWISDTAGDYIGKKFGRYLLTEAIKTCFEFKSKKIWVHTCSLDHKHALSNYLNRGMKIFKQESINLNID